MSNINDLLGAVINKNPVDFSDSLNGLMQQKAADAILARKEELAASLYGTPEEVETAEDDYDIGLDDLDVDADLDDVQYNEDDESNGTD